MSPLRGLAVGLLSVFALAGIGLILIFSWDVHRDRQRTIEFEHPTRLFGGAPDEQCDENALRPIAVIQPGDNFEVRRVGYWKDCMTVEVRSKDHKLKGFVVGGPTFQLSEPH